MFVIYFINISIHYPCMILIIFYMLVMFALIGKNEIVYKGAYDGLMLWFNNVIPLLLPFMLMSALLVEKIQHQPKDKQKKFAVIITLFTGLLCGYPLGAKNTSEFVINKSFDKKTGNLLLPFCNNSSPMFISGYIVYNILEKRISFFNALSLIYLPYIIYLFFALLIMSVKKRNDKKIISIKQPKKNILKINDKSVTYHEKDIIMSTIIQITYVGFYIIICSIISEFIMSLSLLNYEKIKLLAAGISEITKGTLITEKYLLWSSKEKTAIILSLTSFGGISALLQTNNVIKGSELSILRYIIIKTICALSTYGLSLLLLS